MAEGSKLGPKIYTRKGDDGSTGLVGGQRIHKGNLRLDCYGTVDELNAYLGVAAAQLEALKLIAKFLTDDRLSSLEADLSITQNILFNVGSRLACTDPELLKTLPNVAETEIVRLENSIDHFTTQLKPLRNFILPGGSLLAAHLHVARTIARRSERLVARLYENEPGESILLKYLNRLGDYLFVAARYANFLEGNPEVIWTNSK